MSHGACLSSLHTPTPANQMQPFTQNTVHEPRPWQGGWVATRLLWGLAARGPICRAAKSGLAKDAALFPAAPALAAAGSSPTTSRFRPHIFAPPGSTTQPIPQTLPLHGPSSPRPLVYLPAPLWRSAWQLSIGRVTTTRVPELCALIFGLAARELPKRVAKKKTAKGLSITALPKAILLSPPYTYTPLLSHPMR